VFWYILVFMYNFEKFLYDGLQPSPCREFYNIDILQRRCWTIFFNVYWYWLF